MNWNSLELPDNPYYQDDAVIIYNADCRETLPSLPKVDLVLTDYPYGVGVDYGRYIDSPDNLKLLIADTLPLLRTKAKRILLTCGVPNMWMYPQPDWVIAWMIPAAVSTGKWGFISWSPILAYGNDPYLEMGLGRRPTTITMTEKANESGHPSPKPIKFWKLLLVRGSAKTDDIILDPFLGSGTTVEAAKALNRRCIGIEIEEKYCEIAAKRCCQTVMNLLPNGEGE